MIVSSVLPLLFVFIASLYRPYDADLGWHLKYGEYFFQHGRILYENTFSTEMPNFSWANTSWGIDLVYYAIFHGFGFLGLTIAGALVVTAAFYFFSKAFDLSYWQKSLIFPVLIFFENPINQVSFRGQLVSIGLLGVLFYFLSSFEKTKSKLLYAAPLLFLFWANLHGQFVLGLALFALWIVFFGIQKYLENKNTLYLAAREIKVPLFIFLTSIAATLGHPYGINIYYETLGHFQDPLLKNIVEYLAPEELSHMWWNLVIAGVLLFLGGLFLFFEERLFGMIPGVGIVSVMFVLSTWVRRYSWSMYYLTMPLLKPVADFFKPGSKTATFYAGTALFVFFLSIAVLLKMPFSQFAEMNWQTYCEEYAGCSPQGAEFLSAHTFEGKLMSMYNWGGFLIWNYPVIKPGIDGRMHLWRDEKGYSAFEEYFSIEQNFSDVDKSKYDVVFIGKSKPVYQRLVTLTKNKKWKLVYRDKPSAIFIRNK